MFPILSVKQPWAQSLIVPGPRGRKDVECRDWKTAYRGRLWIHAARQVDQRAHAASVAGQDPASLPRGVVIGSVRLVDVVEAHTSSWACDEYNYYWVMQEPHALNPEDHVAVRGMPGLFWAQGSVHTALLACRHAH